MMNRLMGEAHKCPPNKSFSLKCFVYFFLSKIYFFFSYPVFDFLHLSLRPCPWLLAKPSYKAHLNLRQTVLLCSVKVFVDIWMTSKKKRKKVKAPICMKREYKKEARVRLSLNNLKSSKLPPKTRRALTWEAEKDGVGALPLSFSLSLSLSIPSSPVSSLPPASLVVLRS